MLEGKNVNRKVVRRSVAIALGIICIVLVASMITVVASMLNTVSGLTQKYDKEHILVNSWGGNIPNNLNDLFQNKVVLWNDKKLTEPSNIQANETIVYDFNYTGCLLINITTSTSNITWARILWSDNDDEFMPLGSIVTVNYVTRSYDGVGLFPVLKGVTQLQIGFGALDFSGASIQNQTITITYYY